MLTHAHAHTQTDSAARLAEAEAEQLFQRGLMCEKTEDGDLLEAHDCYKRAAEVGHIEASYRYGVCLKHGKGCEKNPETAFNWFMKAAEAGLAAAQVLCCSLLIA
jgi:TPR repeat protein